MKIPSHLISTYSPGTLSPWQPSPQPPPRPDAKESAADAVQASRRVAASLDTAELERLRDELNRGQSSGVAPDVPDAYVRQALQAYGAVAAVERRDYVSQVLGVDEYV